MDKKHHEEKQEQEYFIDPKKLWVSQPLSASGAPSSNLAKSSPLNPQVDYTGKLWEGMPSVFARGKAVKQYRSFLRSPADSLFVSTYEELVIRLSAYHQSTKVAAEELKASKITPLLEEGSRFTSPRPSSILNTTVCFLLLQVTWPSLGRSQKCDVNHRIHHLRSFNLLQKPVGSSQG
jgi:hypothetical protein